MDLHPIQGGVEILLVASCYRNRDKLWPDGPVGSNADFTFASHSRRFCPDSLLSPYIKLCMFNTA